VRDQLWWTPATGGRPLTQSSIPASSGAAGKCKFHELGWSAGRSFLRVGGHTGCVPEGCGLVWLGRVAPVGTDENAAAALRMAAEELGSDFTGRGGAPQLHRTVVTGKESRSGRSPTGARRFGVAGARRPGRHRRKRSRGLADGGGMGFRSHGPGRRAPATRIRSKTELGAPQDGRLTAGLGLMWLGRVAPVSADENAAAA
jgi:hypothetical protein